MAEGGVRRVLIGMTLLAMVAALATSCHPTDPQLWSIDPGVSYHKSIEVDPATLYVRVVSKAHAPEAPIGDYYLGEPQPSLEGFSIIEHWRGNSDGTSDRIETIRVDEDTQLVSRQKHMELLRGDYGVVATDVVYRYHERDQGATFWTLSLPHFQSYEVPKIVDHAPQVGLPLDTVSVVRVVKGGPVYLVLSADYKPSGELRFLHVWGGADGKQLEPHDERLKSFDVVVGTAGFPGRYSPYETLTRFGLPEIFPIERYLADDRNVFGPTELPVVMEAVHFNYDHGRSVQQDILKSPDGPSTRYLTFELTPLDEALRTIDTTVPLNTVELP